MLKAIFGNFSVRFLSAIFNLLIAILVSQYLGAEGKGNQSIILATITLILLFHNIISGSAIVYLASRLNARKLIIVSYSWTILISIITFFILKKTAYFNSDYCLAITFLSALNSFFSINSSLLIGREKINKSNTLNFLVPFLTLSFLFVQFYFLENRNIGVYFSALFFSYLIVFSYSIYLIKSDFIEKDTANSKFQTTFKSLFYFGFQNQLAHVFQLLSFRISFFVIESYQGKEAVGIYSNALSIVEAIWMITSSICLYQYSKIANSDDKDSSLRLTEKLMKLGLFLSFIVICVVVAIPSDFYTWLFGEEFSGLKSLILILLPGVWIYNYYLIIGHYFSGTGRYLINAFASSIGLIVTLFLIFYLVSKFGVMGSALTLLAAYFLTSLSALIIFIRHGGKFVIFPTITEIRNFISLAKNSK